MSQVEPQPTRCSHRGKVAVAVGRFEIFPAGTLYLRKGDINGFDVIVSLTGSFPFQAEDGDIVIAMRDFGGVPSDWREQLENRVIPVLESGRTVMAFCVGSHGRTGTFLASLIALLESEAETPDPIAAVRTRHCVAAVETQAQAEAIFALRDQPLPEKYRRLRA